jgi:hypothetical protein
MPLHQAINHAAKEDLFTTRAGDKIQSLLHCVVDGDRICESNPSYRRLKQQKCRPQSIHSDG